MLLVGYDYMTCILPHRIVLFDTDMQNATLDA
jgi:hypothetical protein